MGALAGRGGGQGGREGEEKEEAPSAAAAEVDEEERCRHFLYQCDPNLGENLD